MDRNSTPSSTASMYSFMYVSAILIVLSLAPISIMYMDNAAQAQNPNNAITTTANSTITNRDIALGDEIDTFRAMGQISSLAYNISDIIAESTNSSGAAMWVLGGTWGLSVVDGNLTNFITDIKMSKIDGSSPHYHSIEKIGNASGNYTIVKTESGNYTLGSDKKIVLEGNSTAISGIADVTTNGKVQWKNVPISLTILNGNVLNLVIGPPETDYHFKGLPVYGTVQSIMDETGKELLTIRIVQ